MAINEELRRLLDLAQPNAQTVFEGRQRQALVGKGRTPDYLPLLLDGAHLVDERKLYCRPGREYCRYNFREQYYDPPRMLFEQLLGLISIARSCSDAQLSIAPKMGAGFLPSVLGLHQRIFEEKEPWPRDRLSKREIADLNPVDLDSIGQRGLLPKALQFVSFFRKHLRSKARIHIDYTWGPFSLAHLIRGDALFTDLFDDREFVHHLMGITTKLYIRSVELLKAAVQEPSERAYNGRFYLSAAGVWSNEDTIVLISPRHVEEFVIPYWRLAYGHFGGAVIHLCGKADHLLDLLLDVPEVKGLNLGEPERQELDPPRLMQRVLDKEKVYYGHWPRNAQETMKQYFERMLDLVKGQKKGMVVAYDLLEDEDPKEAMDLWRFLQDRGR